MVDARERMDRAIDVRESQADSGRGAHEKEAKMIRPSKMLATVGLVAAMILACAGPSAGQRRERPRRRGTRRSRPTLKVGQAAPDFELPILKEGKDAEGNKVNRITGEKIKLSSFRGKKVVCVFFSSYT